MCARLAVQHHVLVPQHACRSPVLSPLSQTLIALLTPSQGVPKGGLAHSQAVLQAVRPGVESEHLNMCDIYI